MGNKNNINKSDGIGKNLTEEEIDKNIRSYYQMLHENKLTFRTEKRQMAINYFDNLNVTEEYQHSNLGIHLKNKTIRKVGKKLVLDIIFQYNTKVNNINLCNAFEILNDKDYEEILDSDNYNTTSDIIDYKKKKEAPTIKIDLRNVKEDHVKVKVNHRDAKNNIESVNTNKMQCNHFNKYKLKNI
jgi:hypothetical protein